MLDQTVKAAGWQSQSAWETANLITGRSGKADGSAGVVLKPLPYIEMATIIVRTGAEAAFDDFARSNWGLAVPSAGHATTGSEGALVWSAPRQWLAVGALARNSEELATALTGTAAVSAQGDGRALVEIGGSHARDALARLLSIDLHPDAFRPGMAAVTAMAHLSIQLWQPQNSSALVLCASRTVAGSVWTMLLSASASFGCETIVPH